MPQIKECDLPITTDLSKYKGFSYYDKIVDIGMDGNRLKKKVVRVYENREAVLIWLDIEQI